ncbi:thiopeptide-type bacteriocin biosynthesis protein [Streptomyces sp. NPDC044571]|uniref:thiopeptide-type bacteriocin biosynthesis protein n=1 Tax=Streptomyces sp. NPDC044571 TaxID=3155371 RepID=UPI0033D18478
MNTPSASQQTEHAVLAVLTGQPVPDIAARTGIDPAELGDAVALYRAAGRDALAAQAARLDWYQFRVEFPDWNRCEDAAALLARRLADAERAGLVGAWWFVRKAPQWRLRAMPGPQRTDRLPHVLAGILDALVEHRSIIRWWPTVYEPEVPAFGGPDAMDIAHALFHADSTHILDHIQDAEPPLGRRELSVLLLCALFRAAGLEWFEQGDVWDKVSRLRPLPADVTTIQLAELGHGIRTLMNADPSPLLAPDGTLEAIAPWFGAFETAGRALGEAAAAGSLERGLRQVLGHHVIFHWNRLGLSARLQALIAHAATHTVMNPDAPLQCGSSSHPGHPGDRPRREGRPCKR